MPKDQWRKANMRARFGPVGCGRPKPRPDDKPKGKGPKGPYLLKSGNYQISHGIHCLIRKIGEKKWKPHVTAVSQTLFGNVHKPGYLIFRKGGYEMMLPASQVGY